MPDRLSDFNRLRAKHPRLTFEQFSVESRGDSLGFAFRFALENGPVFCPTLSIDRPPGGGPALDWQSLGFHLGLIELLSYWKAAASPLIQILTGSLQPAQLAWWRAVYFHGLGEYRYLNGITLEPREFVHFQAEGPTYAALRVPLAPENLVPVGGGKDSVVSLDLLRGDQSTNLLLLLNPTRAQWETARVMGYAREQIVVARRQIDPALLELNRQGYLNGHTPFSALLAFVSVTVAVLHGKQRILLSNERSADESTIPGTLINHQWSKSWMFERMFHDYVQDWLVPDLDYASLLRPWNELQIARAFAGPANVAARAVFRSCNVGHKTDSWCGTCSKCLFVNIVLAPFLPRAEIRTIFGGAEPLNDPVLQPILEQLIGIGNLKPFECIGTIDEVQAALSIVVTQSEPPALALAFAREHPGLVHSPESVDRLLRRRLLHVRRASFFDH